MSLLYFSLKNAKLKGRQAIFDLPAGHSCPFALTCFCQANRETGKITDGPWQAFRCYAASAEAVFPAARKCRWQNFDALKGKTAVQAYGIISTELPAQPLIRIHSSGDFFTPAYFAAWLMVAGAFPDVIFYAYTKAIPYWLEAKKLGMIPSNLKLNASYGGKFDALIKPNGLKSVTVVNSEDEARLLGLEIDHDDTHAWAQDKSFALLIHGNGPKGSFQAKKHNEIARAARKANECKK